VLTKSCTCTRYQENEVPCSHAYAFLLHLDKTPIDYFPSTLCISTWRQTYLENWKPVNLENLADSAISPPTTRRLPARPKKKRAQRGERGLAALQYARRMHEDVVVEDRRQRCRNCGNLGGHNARTCTFQAE